MDRVHRTFRRIVEWEETDSSTFATAWKQFVDLEDLYYEKAIWLPRTTCDQLNTLVDLLRKTGSMAHAVTRADPHAVQQIERWKKLSKQVVEVIPKARGALEQELRGMLGVETDVGPTPTENPDG